MEGQRIEGTARIGGRTVAAATVHFGGDCGCVRNRLGRDDANVSCRSQRGTSPGFW
jgi:hypothetical protein